MDITNSSRALINECLTEIVNRLASQITEQKGRDRKRNGEAYAHFLHGIEHLITQLSLTKGESDQHFEFEVAKYVEEVNELFRRRLHDLLTN